MGEAGCVAEEHPKGDLPFWVLLEGTVDCEIREVRRDWHVEADFAFLHGAHDGGRGEQFGHRLNAEDRVQGDGGLLVSFCVAKALGPKHVIAIDHGHSQPGYVLLGHKLEDPLLVVGDDGGGRRIRGSCQGEVARAWCRRLSWAGEQPATRPAIATTRANLRTIQPPSYPRGGRRRRGLRYDPDFNSCRPARPLSARRLCGPGQDRVNGIGGQLGSGATEKWSGRWLSNPRDLTWKAYVRRAIALAVLAARWLRSRRGWRSASEIPE